MSVFTDSFVNFAVPAACIAIGLSVFGAMIQKNQLDMTANNVARIIAVDGKYDTSEQSKISDYLQKAHVNADVSFSSADGQGKINLGDDFTVRLQNKVTIGAGGGIGTVTLPVTGEAQETSEVYWK